MNFFHYFLENAWEHLIAAMPLLLLYTHLRILNSTIKTTLVSLIFCLITSSYFWFELDDIASVWLQILAYLAAFADLWVTNRLRKNREEQLY